jgi:hypothetical protein
MATPPTRVQLVQPAVGFLNTTTPKTTPSFDVVTGDLLIIQSFSEDVTTGLAAPTWTGTGTITQLESIANANDCTAYLYSLPVTATTTARTVSQARTSGSGMFSFIVTQWRDHGGVGVHSQAHLVSPSTGAPSLTLSGLTANSALQCGNSDWSASDGTTRTWRTVNGSAMTESLYARNTTNYAVYAAYTSDIGSLTSATVGLTAPSTQAYSLLGIEVLGTAGGAPAIPPLLTMQTRRSF